MCLFLFKNKKYLYTYTELSFILDQGQNIRLLTLTLIGIMPLAVLLNLFIHLFISLTVWTLFMYGRPLDPSGTGQNGAPGSEVNTYITASPRMRLYQYNITNQVSSNQVGDWAMKWAF